MNYSFRSDNKILVLSINGELIGGSDNVGLINEVNDHIQKGELKLVIQMEGVRYMNSSGIGLVIALFKQFENVNGIAVISNGSDQILRLLSITKLDTKIKIFDSTDDAIAFLNTQL